MKKINSRFRYILYLLFSVLFVGITSCNSFVPENLDALGDDVQYSTKEFFPYIGRTTMFTDIVSTSNSSTLPLDFKIVEIRDADGVPVPELIEKNYPVKVWKGHYTGAETTLAEIEAKRKIEYRPVLEIQKKSGDLTFWSTSQFAEIQSMPYDGYSFDVEIQNSGGRRYQKNLKLKPTKPRAYEPSQYSELTGLAKNAFVRPTLAFNIVGARTGTFIPDIRVYLNKDVTNNAPGKTLTFSVLDSMGNVINIEKFNRTNWKTLVHGFNHRFEAGKVIYDVAYPIPLIEFPTQFTNPSGTRSRALLAYNRMGFGGVVEDSFLMFDFAIYEEGHWEIQFRFAGESPKFVND